MVDHKPSVTDLRRKSIRAGIMRISASIEGIQVGHSHRDGAVAVHVSKLGYVLFWILVLLARCLCVVFLAATARIYWFVAHPYMSYYADLLGPSSSERFKPIGVCFGLVGAVHAFELLQMVVHSCRLRRFVLDAPPARVSKPVKKSQYQTGWCARVWRACCALGSRGSKLFHRRGFFGVESDFFHLRFVSRELIEIVSQTAQVYNSSVLIAKPWLNNLYVGLMIANCCSTPALHAIVRNSPALERLLCLCCDYMLDAAVSMVVPVIIILPYYHKFDIESFSFDISDLYDDIWFANMVMENQQLFALSNWDLLWKIVPHLSMCSCLGSVSELIRPARIGGSDGWSTQFSQQSDGSSCSISPIDEIPRLPDAATDKSNKNGTERSPHRLGRWTRKRKMRIKGGAMLRVVNVAMILWGLGILTLHLLALRPSMRMEVPGCKQVTRPWFATKFSCSVLEYNCHQYNSTTVRLQDVDVLQEDSVAALVFSHCTELYVPTHIRHYRNLLGIDIFNSTLAEWSLEAAITNVTHPRLTYIIFVRVNMTELPPGVLQTLPPSMTDFEISASNLTHLPEDLHERWQPMSLFYVEHTQITVFPSTLLHLTVDDLSLIGSNISYLPAFGTNHRSFFTFAMSHTPLVALPDSFGDVSKIGFLHLGYTQLLALPAWMDHVVRTATKVFVHNTPFCANKTPEDIALHFGDQAVLTCSASGDRHEGKYPLELMQTRRPF